MRARVLDFLSFIALAILAAGALGVAGVGPLARQSQAAFGNEPFALDYRSLILGTVLGVILSSVGHLPWRDLPRRTVNWIYANERKLIRCVYGVAFLVVLLFY
jgi:hypothetical protein